jgi:hypothetical protein
MWLMALMALMAGRNPGRHRLWLRLTLMAGRNPGRHRLF